MIRINGKADHPQYLVLDNGTKNCNDDSHNNGVIVTSGSNLDYTCITNKANITI
jgi:hypothetical protein